MAKNWTKTTAYLLAFGEPCITIRDQEIELVKENRVLVDLEISELAQWDPPPSWMLAVMLCQDDDVRPFVEWVRRGVDLDRIHFYAHPDADPFQVLAPWQDAGLPAPKVDEGSHDWRRLHKRFGLDLSIQILQDWG